MLSNKGFQYLAAGVIAFILYSMYFSSTVTPPPTGIPPPLQRDQGQGGKKEMLNEWGGGDREPPAPFVGGETERDSKDRNESLGLKEHWSKLVGLDVDKAMEAIKAANPHYNVVKVPEGAMVTRDYRMDRVRVYYKKNDFTVLATPRVG